jgi:chromosome partitioning protein
LRASEKKGGPNGKGGYAMRSILVLNAKGGCGKTTLATNLAANFAVRNKAVALVDFDPQQSSMDWLAVRPEDRAPIEGISGFEGTVRLPRNLDYVVFDAPAGTHGGDVSHLVRRAETILMPVLPSPFDIRAAQRFTDELFHISRVLNKQVRIGTVINRARENSPGRLILEEFLRELRLPDGRKLPFVAVLRASQNYVRAAERGLSVFELGPVAVAHDLELWRPLLRWLGSKRSIPQ